VTSCREGQSLEQNELIDFCRDHLAGYKLPRQIIVVDEVRRAPNGKADYKWAKAEANRHA